MSLDESAHASLAASCEELRARTGNPPWVTCDTNPFSVWEIYSYELSFRLGTKKLRGVDTISRIYYAKHTQKQARPRWTCIRFKPLSVQKWFPKGHWALIWLSTLALIIHIWSVPFPHKISHMTFHNKMASGLINITFTGCSSSNIRSPGYPGSYPENTDCTWRKSTSYDTEVISFDISNLDLEQCARCTCDYVEVFDGSSKSSKSLGKFCTGQVRLLTTGNYLTVVFHTDHSKGEKQNKGFYATYNYISRSSGKLQMIDLIFLFPVEII